jgi:sec-independent protein translocase protein TatB
MGNVGGGEILVILLAALLILGPNKLPEAARQIGRAMGELRKVTSGFQRELQDALKDTDDTQARKRGEAIAATRPLASGPNPTDAAVPTEASTNGAGAEPSTMIPATPEPATAADPTPVTPEQAAAQIPPAPFDATVHAPGADR